MGVKSEAMMALFSIVDRGCADELADLFTRHQLTYHIHCAGYGTASSEMLDILGLGIREKDVMISIGQQALVNQIMSAISNDEDGNEVSSKGIMFSVRLTALNSMVAAVLNTEVKRTGKKGVEYMEQDRKNSMIMVTVNQGYTDEVMITARKAGARGGTIVKARWTDGGRLEQYHGITLQAEREIIFILASDECRNTIMEAINEKHGFTTDAHAVICSMAVDKAIKLN